MGLIAASHGAGLPLALPKLIREVFELAVEIRTDAARGEKIVRNLTAQGPHLMDMLKSVAGDPRAAAAEGGKRMAVELVGGGGAADVG